MRIERNPETDGYGDGDIPEIDTERYKDGARVEGLPEPSGEHRDGPGGNGYPVSL